MYSLCYLRGTSRSQNVDNRWVLAGAHRQNGSSQWNQRTEERNRLETERKIVLSGNHRRAKQKERSFDFRNQNEV